MRAITLLSIKGFKAYLHSQDIKFRNTCYFVLGENKDFPDSANSNATGKTSILDAIFWCLYGKMIDGKTTALADIKHDQAAKATVVITFDDGVQIHREVTTKEKLAYRYGSDQNWTEPDLRVAQKHIDEEILGINWRTFLATCVLSAGATTLQFLRAEPAARSQLLGQLVDDLIFQKAAKAMKGDYDRINAKFQENVIHLSHHQQGIEQGEASLARLKEKLQVEQEQLGQTRNALGKELAALEDKMRTLQNLIETPPVIQAPQEYVERELHKIQQILQTLNQELLQAKWQAGSASWQAGQQCPQCRRVVSKQDAARMSEQAAEGAELAVAIQEQINGAVTQQAQLQGQLVQFSQYRIQVQGWRAEYGHLQERYLLLKDQQARDPLTELKARIADLAVQVGLQRQQVERLNAAQRELAVESDTLNVLIPGFSRDIRNLMFDRIRVELEDITHSTVNRMAKGMFSITYPNTTNKNREKFEINVMRKGKSRDLSTYSGGEAWRASCSVLFSLRRVMLNQSRAKVDVLLIDDPMGELDEVGLAKFFDVISELQRVEGALIVATTPARTPPVIGNAEVIRVVYQNEVASIK